jgi:hypothetical protein
MSDDQLDELWRNLLVAPPLFQRLDVVERNARIDRLHDPVQLGRRLLAVAAQVQQDRHVARAHLEQREVPGKYRLNICPGRAESNS